MKTALICILLSALSLGNVAHKFYMSITEMQYNSTTEKLEVIVKVFTDDIEKAVETKVDYRLFLATDKEHASADSLIEDYFKNHFTLKEQDQALKFDFLGKEAKTDYTWLYLEVDGFHPEEKHSLMFSLLTDLFEDQKNQVNYYHEGETTTLNLHKGHLKANF